ncbi:T-cell antigen CD7 isoform X2 [Oxyura jamaicensis]|uniref:T-cell antigen CD7 isoform X2 n=1 Tax=Oxyura jamaicensis TaxID=8884 RepID=UPI0015A62072|nr:T-cell antigen CD7 isoform X2 [Oxyura jamaicensis]
MMSGDENTFLEQPTDVVSVWEGDSDSITCSIYNSENELGMYLRTQVPPDNVLYVPKDNKPTVLPAFVNRIKYSKEGAKLTVTLLNARESDSNFYLCTRFTKRNGYHVRLDGKTTIVVVKAAVVPPLKLGINKHGAGIVEQSPLIVDIQQGQSINITCVLNSSYEDEEIYLLKTHMQPEGVLRVSSQKALEIFPHFANRLEYSKQEKKLVITLHSLQQSDSDVYVCAAVLKNTSLFSMSQKGTMVLVKGGEETAFHNRSWAYYGLIIMAVLLFSVLMCFAVYCVHMKKYFQKRKTNTVYEDMSYGSRRNTFIKPNIYTNDT